MLHVLCSLLQHFEEICNSEVSRLMGKQAAVIISDPSEINFMVLEVMFCFLFFCKFINCCLCQNILHTKNLSWYSVIKKFPVFTPIVTQSFQLVMLLNYISRLLESAILYYLFGNRNFSVYLTSLQGRICQNSPTIKTLLRRFAFYVLPLVK